MKVRYFTDIDEISEIPVNERASLKEVTDRYSFRVNDYYLSLIDWDDPDDPIKKIIIPENHELTAWGALDPSNEAANYVAPGCQHKYPHTALILVNEICGGYCRFCFRKRIFSEENEEVSKDINLALDYIASHQQITNVLLTGGDPLILSSEKLEDILRPLRKIQHVQIIRIGTKMPAFNPMRIIDDPELPAVISRYSTRTKRVYFMTHFNHPREITNKAALALDILLKAGAIVTNQTPVLRGINNDPETLTELMEKLSYIGVPPYYFFQCRPTAGNKTYAVSITETYTNLEIAKSKAGGLARRARHVMSHATGKIEVIGVTDRYIYLKYHRARNRSDDSRMLVFKRNDKAYWLDDFERDGDLVHNHAVIESIRPF